MWWSLFLFPAVIPPYPLDEIPATRGAAGRVVVNEVYYDHPGRDDGWEFVELYNAGRDTVDLSLWRIESLDGASGRARCVWTGAAPARIGPGEVVCVAGGALGPASGYLLAGGLENGPDAVRLVSPAGIEDLIGYGPLALEGLFEGGPAPDVPAGSSLARKPDGADSDRNDVDFTAATPTPGRRNFFARDLALSHAPPDELPCPGAPFAFKLKFANAGLERFECAVRVRVVVESGLAADSAAARKELRLDPGALDSIAVKARAPFADRFAVRSFVEGAPDDWAGDDSLRFELRTSPGDVVVNEIMYRPGDGECEWVEIVCAGGASRDLAGWTICDAAGSRRLISREPLVLAPFRYLVLARDSSVFAARYPRCAAPVRTPAGGWPSLNDTGRDGVADRVSLHDDSGALVESVAYRDLLGAERGRSIERLSETACSALPGGVWHRSAARDRATPGAENSTRSSVAPKGTRPALAPNPFSPSRHGSVSISGALAGGEVGFRVRIFSMAGIELRRVFAESGGARTFSCKWDGTDDGGAVLPPGMYVCLVEYIGTGGGVCRREKLCVVVAAG
ncbi:MAG: hypothetical protein C4574_00205 [Candidatus Latescibacterota bacterium]|jgi:hypothetical protein|nr:MAG: hypothetical protein C4574_00205 [Candidatus Latescibacterota bacterium]